MALNQNYAIGNQDVSLTNFDMITESPPRRGSDFMATRGTYITMNKWRQILFY